MTSKTKTTTPIRMGKVYSKMLIECPKDISVYGACVANIEGGINKNACEKEFAKLKECFHRVLRTTIAK